MAEVRHSDRTEKREKFVNLQHKPRNAFMNENTIKEALKKGERVTLECKKAMAEVPKSLWETYSAFANTIGGLILLGVDEHKNNEVGFGTACTSF